MSITMGQLASLLSQESVQVKSTMSSKLRVFAQLSIGEMKNQIHIYHAVDTGTMLNSVTSDHVSDMEYLIGPTVDYSTFVANGTSRVNARPFHEKTADVMRGRVQEVFGSDILKNL